MSTSATLTRPYTRTTSVSESESFSSASEPACTGLARMTEETTAADASSTDSLAAATCTSAPLVATSLAPSASTNAFIVAATAAPFSAGASSMRPGREFVPRLCFPLRLCLLGHRSVESAASFAADCSAPGSLSRAQFPSRAAAPYTNAVAVSVSFATDCPAPCALSRTLSSSCATAPDAAASATPSPPSRRVKHWRKMPRLHFFQPSRLRGDSFFNQLLRVRFTARVRLALPTKGVHPEDLVLTGRAQARGHIVARPCGRRAKEVHRNSCEAGWGENTDAR